MSRQQSGLTTVDHVEQRRWQWAQELPELDTVGMAILGRARWITLRARPQIEEIFTRYGLDAGEFDVLSTLRRSGPPYRLRPTELFQSLMISSGGLTDRLMRLEKAGLVTRVPSEEDKRSLLVELTEEGRARAEMAFREDMAVEAQMLEVLEPQEREDLARLLAKLAKAMEEEG